MVEKSASAFRTISEVADALDLPQHVLRFWETKFPSVKPMKRGGGRRYYRPEDMDLLRTIRDLLYDQGYTIKGVQKLLRQHGPKGLVTLGDAPAVAMPPEKTATQPALNFHSPSTVDTQAGSDPKKAAISAAIAELQSIKELLQAV